MCKATRWEWSMSHRTQHSSKTTISLPYLRECHLNIPNHSTMGSEHSNCCPQYEKCHALMWQSYIGRHICWYWAIGTWTCKIPDILWTLSNATWHLLWGNSACSERVNQRNLVKTELLNVSIICPSADFAVLLWQWYSGSKKTCGGKPKGMKPMS